MRALHVPRFNFELSFEGRDDPPSLPACDVSAGNPVPRLNRRGSPARRGAAVSEVNVSRLEGRGEGGMGLRKGSR